MRTNTAPKRRRGAAALLLLWVYDAKVQAAWAKFKALGPGAKTAILCILGLIVLVFGMYGIGFQANDFIYGGF